MVYSCDTHLVLVGETTATCSYPSLQWLPPSNDVLCVEPSGSLSFVEVRSEKLFTCFSLFITNSAIPQTTTPTATQKTGNHNVNTTFMFKCCFFVILDQHGRGSGSLSTGEAVVATAVVCVVCSFTAGLLVGVLLTQCVGVCGRRRKRGQTEIPPVYEDITLEKTAAIQLQTNEAYGFTLSIVHVYDLHLTLIVFRVLFTQNRKVVSFCYSISYLNPWRARLRLHYEMCRVHEVRKMQT